MIWILVGDQMIVTNVVDVAFKIKMNKLVNLKTDNET